MNRAFKWGKPPPPLRAVGEPVFLLPLEEEYAASLPPLRVKGEISLFFAVNKTSPFFPFCYNEEVSPFFSPFLGADGGRFSPD